MVDTNVLLGIVFSIITNDMSRVPAPDACVPRSTNDLRIYALGSPYSPIDVSVQCRGGAQYWICDAMISGFDSGRSIFGEQNPSRLDTYEGVSIVTSNKAVTIASNVLQRLIKPGFALSNAVPRLHQAGVYESLPPSQWHPMPFYEVEWPSVSDAPWGAFVDIDGRNARVVGLQLHDIAYRDFALAEKIKSEVYRPDPGPKPVRETYISIMQKQHYPPPTEAYAREAIPKWLSFCRRVGCDPGNQTNASDIRWDASWVYTRPRISTSAPVCEIRFRNGVSFQSIEGITLSHYSADACFAGLWGGRLSEEWAPWWAKRTKDWKDWKTLAKGLEPVLVERLGIPKELLTLYHPMPGVRPAEPGKWGYTRLLVEWRDFPLTGEKAVSDTKMAFQAEFDAQTGSLKSISFLLGDDSRFKDALRAAEVRRVNH